MKFEYGSINFEELKSFERRRENTRVYFSDKPALPIVIKFKQVLAIKGGGRPTRLLPHGKMLLIPIKLFLSAG